jgi:hypothetical protein
MTEDKALAMAREAMRQAIAIHRTKEAVMASLNQECRADPELMEAFLIVGQAVVSNRVFS